MILNFSESNMKVLTGALEHSIDARYENLIDITGRLARNFMFYPDYKFRVYSFLSGLEGDLYRRDLGSIASRIESCIGDKVFMAKIYPIRVNGNIQSVSGEFFIDVLRREVFLIQSEIDALNTLKSGYFAA